MPVSVLEGMALGLVPIVSQMPTGIEELVQSGVNGVVVQRDPEKFTAAVRRLIEDEGHQFQKMSQAAFETVRTEYSIGVTAQRWAKLMSSVIERKELPLSSRSPAQVKLPPRHPALAEYDLRPPGVWERIVGRVKRQFTSKK
jgi:spore maturation protein CgeB